MSDYIVDGMIIADWRKVACNEPWLSLAELDAAHKANHLPWKPEFRHRIDKTSILSPEKPNNLVIPVDMILEDLGVLPSGLEDKIKRIELSPVRRWAAMRQYYRYGGCGWMKRDNEGLWKKDTLAFIIQLGFFFNVNRCNKLWYICSDLTQADLNLEDCFS